MRMPDTRARRARARPRAGTLALQAGTLALLAGATAFALCGCGAGGTPSAGVRHAASVPAYVTEPFSHEQQLVEQGAHLVVADGCSACHLIAPARNHAPSFSSFAGHRVTLSDGRRALVDERFLRAGLLDPRGHELRGYDAAPMLAALAHLRLRADPGQAAALAAFIEQVGPEP